MSVDDGQLVAVVAAVGSERVEALAAGGEALGRGDALEVLAGVDGAVAGEGRIRVPGPFEAADAGLVEVFAGAAGARLLELGELEEAGRVAVAADHPELLRAVIRTTLRVQPPRVPAPTLRSWRDSGVLPDDSLHTRWLAAACLGAGGAAPAEVAAAYEAVWRAFGDTGDLEAEISVGLAAAVHARRADDLLLLAALAQRAEDLLAAGHDEALAPAVLGRTLRLQIMGDPAGALAALADYPDDRLAGEWAAQVAMIRGTNLMLLGRTDEALEALKAATGHGSDWTYAVALELTGTARWHDGDAVGAISDLRWAEQVAQATGAAPTAQLAACHRAVLEAALGWTEADATARALDPATVGEECARLLAVAEVLRAIGAGDRARAIDLARALPRPDRAVRSAPWIVSLCAALDVLDDELVDAANAHPSLVAAMAAGEQAARHLAGGPLVPAPHRNLLPAAWCEPVPSTVEIHLIGDASVHIDGRPVHHPDWDRTRVRELCLHLALFTNSARSAVAARIWPDRDPEGAVRNLRVTLTYLVAVLDPDHPKGSSTPLLDDRAGMLYLAHSPRLRIDVRRSQAAAEEVVTAAAMGDDAGLVRAARALERLPDGALLGGAVAPAWVEQHDADRRELLLRAATTGAPRLAALGLPHLAESLARRGLDQDPWAERLHQVVVRCRLAVDDLDGARRAVRRALTALDDLGVAPEPATADLAALAGLAV